MVGGGHSNLSPEGLPNCGSKRKKLLYAVMRGAGKFPRGVFARLRFVCIILNNRLPLAEGATS
jgi:hypothetical protein